MTARKPAVTVAVPLNIVRMTRKLLHYMSDHGGGTTYPLGDCPDDAMLKCPSCLAYRLEKALLAAEKGS